MKGRPSVGRPGITLNTVGQELQSPVYCVSFHRVRTPVRDVPNQAITRAAPRAYRSLGADRVTFARHSAISSDRVTFARYNAYHTRSNMKVQRRHRSMKVKHKP